MSKRENAGPPPGHVIDMQLTAAACNVPSDMTAYRGIDLCARAAEGIVKLSNKVWRVLNACSRFWRPSYVYRGLAALSRDNPNAWFVSGHDRYNGKRGILEWCHDEVDARHLFERMQQFPHQFEALHWGQYSQVDWVRTTWDTHY